MVGKVWEGHHLSPGQGGVAAKLAGRLSHGRSGELKACECSEKWGCSEHKGEAWDLGL